MRHGADIAAVFSMKDVASIAAKYLARSLQENSLRRRQDALDRDSGVVDAILASHQVGADQRPVDPRKHVVVHGVDLTKCRPHLAHLRNDAPWKSRKRDVP